MTIAKLQQLPESLLQEVSDFIDFVAHKHQFQSANHEQQDVSQAWEKWFKTVDSLDVAPAESNSEY